MSSPKTSQALSPSTVLCAASEVSYQDLGEEEGGVVLQMDTGEMYTINDTALSFLKLVDGKRSIVAIKSEMLKEYEVAADELESDLIEIAQQLLADKLLEPIGA